MTYIPCQIGSKAVDLAIMFYDKVVCKYGMPSKIIDDRDSWFYLGSGSH